MWGFGGQIDKIWPTPLVFLWSFCPILDFDLPVVGFQLVGCLSLGRLGLSLSLSLKTYRVDLNDKAVRVTSWQHSILIISARVLTGWVCSFTAYCFICLFDLLSVLLVSDWLRLSYQIEISLFMIYWLIGLRLDCLLWWSAYASMFHVLYAVEDLNDIYMHVLLTIYSWKVLNLAGSTQALNFNKERWDQCLLKLGMESNLGKILQVKI